MTGRPDKWAMNCARDIAWLISVVVALVGMAVLLT